MPGSTSCLLFCSSLYKGKYFGNKGLGPIKLISPLSTLMSCGISSREVLRTKLPTLVNRSASGNKLPSLSFLSFIDLNLMILKMRSSFPGLDKKEKWLALNRKKQSNGYDYKNR